MGVWGWNYMRFFQRDYLHTFHTACSFVSVIVCDTHLVGFSDGVGMALHQPFCCHLTNITVVGAL